MYTDQIYLLVAITTLLTTIITIIYLLLSKKRSRLYTHILNQETQRFDAVSIATQKQTTQNSSRSGKSHNHHAIHHYPSQAHPSSVAFSQVLNTNKTHHFFTPQDLKPATAPILDFDVRALQNQYTILREIERDGVMHKGMSRVFVARKENTENEWIVKFIPNTLGKVSVNEVEILKALNHISLPRIADIFTDKNGVYIVESYMEGVGLDQLLQATVVPELELLNWAEDLTQALSYLHSMNPNPIYHLDIKPSNILATHGNKLVLIDFGISHSEEETTTTMLGATPQYAAPEQFKRNVTHRNEDLIEWRFGELPSERMNWPLDGRTDIFSLGLILFEAATGVPYSIDNKILLQQTLTARFGHIIMKCLAINPLDRYQTISELLEDIQLHRQKVKPDMTKNLLIRRILKSGIAACLAVSIGAFIASWHLFQLEVQAAFSLQPPMLMVSVNQSSEIEVTRIQNRDGTQQIIDPSQLSWQATASNIAQVDGNRVIGLNIGETTIQGTYRMHDITMHVNVVDPMHGMVDISMRFAPGGIVRRFAGTSYRSRIDGTLATAEFVSPESITMTANGSIYFADAGYLRRIRDGEVETVYFTPAHIMPRLVTAYGNDLYILTNIWYDDGHFFGIIRYNQHGMDGIFLGDARFTSVRDIAVANGFIYILEHDYELEVTFLRTINLNNTSIVRTLVEVPVNVSALDVSGDNVFLADPEQGAIFLFDRIRLIRLAGAEGERHFIDGPAPLFYRPTRISYRAGALYIWDFNVLRRLTLYDSAVKEAISIAGVASPVFGLEFGESYPASRIILPYSLLADFVVLESGVLMTDPRRGVVWKVEN